jgi:hypothetical protein
MTNAKKWSKKQEENLLLDNKNPAEMTSKERKKLTVEFAPGCFDNFDGSQEELDELVATIQKMIVSGELFESGEPVDLEALAESNDPEDQLFLEKILSSIDNEAPRNLQ